MENEIYIASDGSVMAEADLRSYILFKRSTDKNYNFEENYDVGEFLDIQAFTRLLDEFGALNTVCNLL